MRLANPGSFQRPMMGRPAQRGYSLMSVLLAILLSLISVTAMVVLLASTMGRNATTIQMTGLAQDLRAAMQLMARDLRRANFHSSFMQCFGNTNCRVDLGIGNYVNTINIDAAGDCFWFWLDRNADGDLSNDATGAYRLAPVNGVGTIQMRIGGNDPAQCELDDGWELITDPDIIRVTAFSVQNTASYTDVLSAAGDSQVVEKISLAITGELVRDSGISKQIRDVVHVRNDVKFAPPVAAAP